MIYLNEVFKMKEFYNAPEVEVVKFAPVEDIAEGSEKSYGYNVTLPGDEDYDGVG